MQGMSSFGVRSTKVAGRTEKVVVLSFLSKKIVRTFQISKVVIVLSFSSPE